MDKALLSLRHVLQDIGVHVEAEYGKSIRFNAQRKSLTKNNTTLGDSYA